MLYLSKTYHNRIQELAGIVKEDFQYPSDNIRYQHILKAKGSDVDTDEPSEQDLLDTFDGADDLTVVKNHGDTMIYYEGWVESCWEGLFCKPEYKGLKKKDAIKKFMTERFPEIVKKVGEKIVDWEFGDNILRVKISNTSKVPVHLAEILSEIDMETKQKLYDKSSQRTPFSRDIMKKAIDGGMEVGLLFQSNNEKYKMPVSKYRIIHPTTMGMGKDGNLLLRGVHVTGQSEEKARKSGVRSAEAENEWRLFKTDNIKSMFLTGRYFLGPLPNYNPNDSAMGQVIAAFDYNKAKKYQDDLLKNQKVDLKAQKDKEKIKDLGKEEPKPVENKPVPPKSGTPTPQTGETPEQVVQEKKKLTKKKR